MFKIEVSTHVCYLQIDAICAVLKLHWQRSSSAAVYGYIPDCMFHKRSAWSA
jgi:hypothetical protein